MHDLCGTPHGAAIGFAQALMTKTHAERWQRRSEFEEQILADAGIRRRPRPRRKHGGHRIQFDDLGEGNLIVPPDRDSFTQLAQILHEVVRERVIVVDHQDELARGHGQPEPSSAWSNAEALLRVSRNSSAGTESATMPAAAWTVAQPSFTTMVRIAMQASRSPVKLRYPIPPAYTPRRSPSSSAMISMARILGAPVTVPDGKQARRASMGVQSARSLPVMLETRCMTCE